MVILTALLAGLLVACAEGGGQPGPTVGATPPGGTEPAPAEGDTISGTLGGDASLEGGCAWVESGEVRWEVDWPDGYEISFDPLTLTGPEGFTASEGDRLTVTGSAQEDAVTICQVGPLWVGSSVTLD